ncbi:uncharacterized protein FTOL_07796 [Fusarium torulosum]|uniref:Nephrocystin 3-like N-terminal domain-containing protein n=1 Tax=Fusarium torulosum TaxID=33205 RepID=A0AAE8SJV5_9HYPO|nr:uncharacterized protein FTOL_07796 [Fusarium torulosum]
MSSAAEGNVEASASASASKRKRDNGYQSPKEQLQVSTQHLAVSTDSLAEHRRINIDVRDSPRCESGTRVRIQQTIQQWAEGDTGNLFFWLAGPAGTGKSTITRTVADSFVRQKRVVAGYFFKRGEQGRNDTNRIFSTLATQSAPIILNAFRPHKAVRKLLLHQEFSADYNSDQDLWPIVEDLDRLVELATTSEPLFIYAATLCRVVYDEKRPRNSKSQLKLWQGVELD